MKPPKPKSFRGIKPKSGGIVARPPAPNAGLRAKYAGKIKRLNQRMSASVLWWLGAMYRAREGEIVGDASPAAEAQKEIARLTREWGGKYDAEADAIAAWFVSTADTATTSSLFSSLRPMMPTVKPTMTRRTQNILKAMTQENVGLIKSIPAKYFEQIQGSVMRAMATGRDLETLKAEILALGESTDKRADLIARDQANKATSVINRARQRDLGITKAVWMHMRGGKHPRESHVAADGEEFELSKGMYIDGEWIQPGEEVNCFPEWSKVEFTAGCKKLWRRWYSGKLTRMVTDSGEVIEATPNHPILTASGWKAIKSIDVGEYVFKIGDQVFDVLERNVERDIPSIGQIFDAASLFVGATSLTGARFEFHGDATNQKVDTVDIDGLLPNEFNSAFCKQFSEFMLADADHCRAGAADFKSQGPLFAPLQALLCAPQGVVRSLCAVLALFQSSPSSAHDVCSRAASNFAASCLQSREDGAASNTVLARKLEHAYSSPVAGNNFSVGQLVAIVSRGYAGRNYKTPCAQVLGEVVRVNGKSSGDFSHTESAGIKLARVVEKGVGVNSFSGHVYNLETWVNWYSVNSVIVHNCGCIAAPVIPGFDD